MVPSTTPQAEAVVVLSPLVFREPLRRDILHLCAVQHLDSLRQGSAHTKTRSEVAGSGRKIMRQKGSGKARVGDRLSPIRRGGGVAFGPKPRDFSTLLPRKVREMGMRVLLSARLRDTRLGVVESLEWPSGKTKILHRRIEQLGWRKTLFVTGKDAVPSGLDKSSSNLPDVAAIQANELTVFEALKWQRIVLDVEAVEFFEKTLTRKPQPAYFL